MRPRAEPDRRPQTSQEAGDARNYKIQSSWSDPLNRTLIHSRLEPSVHVANMNRDWTERDACGAAAWGAAHDGRTEEVVRLLTAHSDEVNYASPSGQSIMYTAAWKGHDETVQALSNLKADVNQASGLVTMRTGHGYDCDTHILWK